MSFLNTIFLWGLAAATIPVIIHLIKRNKAKRTPFAAMRFLDIEPNKRVRSQSLKQLLLLVMRILAIALLILAFARPFLVNRLATPFLGAESKAAVILIDNSYSMMAGDKFKLAVEKTSGILRSFQQRDEATVIQFARQSQIVAQAKSDFQALADQLPGKLNISNESTEYLQALQTAESILLASARSSKDIYLISDFQKSAWETINPHWRVHSRVNVNFVVADHNDQQNSAIREVLISRQTKKKGRVDITANIVNYGKESQTGLVSLRLKSTQKSTQTITIPPAKNRLVQFKDVNLPPGAIHGAIEIKGKGDIVDADNIYHFVIEETMKPKILAINGEPRADIAQDELFFVAQAINLPNAKKFTLVEAKSKDLPNHSFNAYRAIILANVKEIPRRQVERLEHYVRNGGGLLLTMGDQVNISIFNTLFQNLSPAQINNPAFKNISAENSLIIAESDFKHPIFRPFSEPGQGDLGVAQFLQYMHVTPNDDESVIARFDDESPAILERRVGEGKVVLWTSTLDNEWNDLPIKAMYLPLLYQTLNYIAAQQKGQQAFLVGSSIKTSSLQTASNDIVIQTPSGKSFPIKSPFFEETNEIGVYQIHSKRGSSPPRYFAVNVNSAESDLTPLTPKALQAQMENISKNPTQAASIYSGELVANQEKAQKLWRFAIILVIFLLFGETWLANRTYR